MGDFATNGFLLIPVCVLTHVFCFILDGLGSSSNELFLALVFSYSKFTLPTTIFRFIFSFSNLVNDFFLVGTFETDLSVSTCIPPPLKIF
ncbi:unnamed protein product [Meloidogyne enterolobii]|uniref:Uncharacterized protein n=1 Tax=Meloidogyne enterolobii TaxID=390850 RepID=A0ACB0ZD51_MELEN